MSAIVSTLECAMETVRQASSRSLGLMDSGEDSDSDTEVEREANSVVMSDWSGASTKPDTLSSMSSRMSLSFTSCLRREEEEEKKEETDSTFAPFQLQKQRSSPSLLGDRASSPKNRPPTRRRSGVSRSLSRDTQATGPVTWPPTTRGRHQKKPLRRHTSVPNLGRGRPEVERLFYTEQDVLEIASNDQDFARLKRNLKNHKAITNGFLEQRLFAFVHNRKKRIEMGAAKEQLLENMLLQRHAQAGIQSKKPQEAAAEDPEGDKGKTVDLEARRAARRAARRRHSNPNALHKKDRALSVPNLGEAKTSSSGPLKTRRRSSLDLLVEGSKDAASPTITYMGRSFSAASLSSKRTGKLPPRSTPRRASSNQGKLNYQYNAVSKDVTGSPPRPRQPLQSRRSVPGNPRVNFKYNRTASVPNLASVKEEEAIIVVPEDGQPSTPTIQPKPRQPATPRRSLSAGNPRHGYQNKPVTSAHTLFAKQAKQAMELAPPVMRKKNTLSLLVHEPATEAVAAVPSPTITYMGRSFSAANRRRLPPKALSRSFRTMSVPNLASVMEEEESGDAAPAKAAVSVASSVSDSCSKKDVSRPIEKSPPPKVPPRTRWSFPGSALTTELRTLSVPDLSVTKDDESSTPSTPGEESSERLEECTALSSFGQDTSSKAESPKMRRSLPPNAFSSLSRALSVPNLNVSAVQEYRVKQYKYTKEDVLAITASEEAFARLKRSLKANKAITNETIKQRMHAFVHNRKRRIELAEKRSQQPELATRAA